MKLVGFTNSFASGEIGPDAWERSDLQQVQTGCEAAFNLIGLTTGAAVSRGGFYRRGAPKFQGFRQRVFPWARADGEGLVVEFGELYGRVWTARGAQIMDPSNPAIPYEFAHGYSAADLPFLRLKQVGDVGYFTSQIGLLYVELKRVADDNWQVVIPALRNGPWLPENRDPAFTFTFTSLGGGSWQIDASSPKFIAGEVGAMQYLVRPPGGGPGLLTWAPNTAKTAGDQVISVGRVYSADNTATSGNTPPNHDAGSVSDGGVSWTFLHDGAQALSVTGYTSPTRITAQEQGTLPFPDLTVTPNWSDLALGAVHGYPTALAAIREERLGYAGAADTPDTLFLTRTAGFTPEFLDFKPGLGTGLVVDDDSVKVQLGDTRARIVWMVDALPLVVGTTEAEWVVSGPTLDDPITPSGAKGRRISGYGSADVMPVLIQGPPAIILHVARGATTVRELILGDGGTSGLGAGRDLSLLAQHIFGVGIAEWAWSRPDNNLWIRLADNTLACLTYHYEHGIVGARRQPLGGGWFCESLCASPDPDGKDRLHVAAIREKPVTGAIQRAHFVLALRGDVTGVGGEGVFMDCCEVYDGAPVTTITGLSHLADESVAVLADGAFLDDLVVSGAGEVELPAAASVVQVGQAMLRKLKTLPFDPNQDGAPTARKGRPSHVYVVLGGVHAVIRAEPQNAVEERPIPEEIVLQRRDSDVVPVVRRFRQRVALGSSTDEDVRTIIESFQPFDLQIFAIRPDWEGASG